MAINRNRWDFFTSGGSRIECTTLRFARANTPTPTPTEVLNFEETTNDEQNKSRCYVDISLSVVLGKQNFIEESIKLGLNIKSYYASILIIWIELGLGRGLVLGSGLGLGLGLGSLT